MINDQAQSLNPWAQSHPYSYEQGGTFGQGQGAAQGGNSQPGLMSAIAPMLGSLFAPNQGGQQQAPQPAPAPLAPQPQYTFGADQDNTAQENKANAAALGQGVLAASQQAAAKQGGGMGQKKKLGQGGGDAGLGATPGSEGY